MYGKSNMEAYITICKIDSQWVFAVWIRKLKHCEETLSIGRDGMGREMGWGFRRERIYTYIPMADSC